MKISTLTFAIVCAPAALIAQQATGTATATTSTQTNVAIPASYSAQAHAIIEAAFKRAEQKKLPDQAMRARMAEGQAKGASDAQVAAAVQRAEARLEASQSAMIRAGRKNPTPQEVNSGEQAMARGASEAQVEVVAKHAPSDRSLVVAFDVLSKLQAEGKPVDQAIAQITAKLDARATDDALVSLTSNASAAGAANAHGNNPNASPAAAAAGSASAGVGAAVNGAGNAAAGVGAAVSGAVKGVAGTKKP